MTENSMSKLHIGEGFLLPKDVVTATTVVYGGKGMGKTNFGSVLVEELTKASLRWAVLDPMGVWWGLRHSRDGKSPGIPCLILGGSHGDIPIEPTGGVVVADLVADEEVNVIIDFSRKPNGEAWGVGEKIRFVTDYGRRLFQRQSSLVGGQRREPLLQVMDEAARFIPQMIRAGQPELAMCLSVWAQIVEEGRNAGLGVVLLTQRSARLNKDVAELADAMLAFRTVGPNSIDAVTDWLGEHVPPAHIKEIIEKLRSLPRGTCLVVSPGWLQVEEILAVRERDTFDSSATPKPGESVRRVTGNPAKPDLAKYAERMKETIEKAKADDPKELRRTIAELRKQLTQRPVEQKVSVEKKVVDPQAIARAVAVAVRPYREQLAKIKQFTARGHKSLAIVRSSLEWIDEQLGTIPQPTIPVRLEGEAGLMEGAVSQRIRNPQSTLQVAAPALPMNGNSAELSGPERKILRAMGELLSIGKEHAPVEMVAAWSGYSPQGGAFGNPRGALRSKGLIDYPQPGLMTLTDSGRALIGPQEPPDREEIWRRIESTCTGPEVKILRALIDNAGAEELPKDQLAEKAGYSPIGGAFGNPVGALRTKGLLDYPRQGVVKAADWLFVEALQA